MKVRNGGGNQYMPSYQLNLILPDNLVLQNQGGVETRRRVLNGVEGRFTNEGKLFERTSGVPLNSFHLGDQIKGFSPEATAVLLEDLLLGQSIYLRTSLHNFRIQHSQALRGP